MSLGPTREENRRNAKDQTARPSPHPKAAPKFELLRHLPHLLRRERPATDARSCCLQLSDEGAQVAREGMTIARADQDMLTQQLAPAERVQLIALLRKMLGFD